jgi:outer membrane protein
MRVRIDQGYDLEYAFNSRSLTNIGAGMSRQIRWLTALLAISVLTSPAWAQQPASAVTPAAPAASQVEELTLEEAVALALRENREVKVSRLELAKFADRLAVAKTHRLPQFNFSILAVELLKTINFDFKKGDLGSLPGVGPVPDRDIDVVNPRRPAFYFNGGAFQPVTQQYRLSLVDKKIKTGREIAREELRGKQQEIVSNVKKAYYAVLQSQSALESVEQTLKLYQELDRVTDHYIIEQTALKADSLEVKTRVQKIVYEAMTLRDQLEDQKEKLNNLMARDIRTEFRVRAVPEAARYEVDLTAARDLALSQRPEVNQARLKVKAAEYDRRIKKSEYIPDLSFGVGFISPQNVRILPENVVYAGFLLVWEPFDWGRKSHEMSERSKAIEQAETGLLETQNQVQIEVGDKFRKLRQSRQMLITAQLAQATATENVRVFNARYTAQESLFKDVLQSQASLAEANHQYQQALLSFWTSKADFEKAIGADQ